MFLVKKLGGSQGVLLIPNISAYILLGLHNIGKNTTSAKNCANNEPKNTIIISTASRSPKNPILILV